MSAARLVEGADLILFFVLVRRCVGRTDVALAGALLLLVTPAHAAFGRQPSPDGMWPVPFMLAVGVSVVVLAERRSTRSSWVVARPPVQAALLPVVVIGAAALTGVLIIVRGAAWQRAATVATWFWNFYLPSHLFLNPDAPGLCGMFLTPTAVPMVAGIYALIRAGGDVDVRLRVAGLLIVGGCLAAPLAAAIAGPPPLERRAMIVVPFGVLLAVVGAWHLWRHGRLAGRVALGALAVLAAIQAAVCLA